MPGARARRRHSSPRCRQAVLAQDGRQQGFQFCDGARRDRQPVAHGAGHVRRMVDQIIRPGGMPVVVEELDAQVTINRQHPIARFVYLVQQRPFVGGQAESHHRPPVGQALAPGDGGGGHRQQARRRAEQIGQLLRTGQRLRNAVQRPAQPGDGLIVLAVFHREGLHQTVDECSLVRRACVDGPNLFGG